MSLKKIVSDYLGFNFKKVQFDIIKPSINISYQSQFNNNLCSYFFTPENFRIDINENYSLPYSLKNILHNESLLINKTELDDRFSCEINGNIPIRNLFILKDFYLKDQMIINSIQDINYEKTIDIDDKILKNILGKLIKDSKENKLELNVGNNVWLNKNFREGVIKKSSDYLSLRNTASHTTSLNDFEGNQKLQFNNDFTKHTNKLLFQFDNFYAKNTIKGSYSYKTTNDILYEDLYLFNKFLNDNNIETQIR